MKKTKNKKPNSRTITLCSLLNDLLIWQTVYVKIVYVKIRIKSNIDIFQKITMTSYYRV